MNKKKNNTKPAEKDFFIVGVGASAGGLEAIQQLFDNIHEHTNMAFVIIQHISPDFKSLMPELLAKHTKMKIFTAEDLVLCAFAEEKLTHKEVQDLLNRWSAAGEYVMNIKKEDFTSKGFVIRYS